jgi:hypothetical protein
MTEDLEQVSYNEKRTLKKKRTLNNKTFKDLNKTTANLQANQN